MNENLTIFKEFEKYVPIVGTTSLAVYISTIILYDKTIFGDESIILLLSIVVLITFFCHNYLLSKKIFWKFLLINSLIFLVTILYLIVLSMSKDKAIFMGGLAPLIFTIFTKGLSIIYKNVFKVYPHLFDKEKSKTEDISYSFILIFGTMLIPALIYDLLEPFLYV
jgi:hypothetical protein